MSLPCATHCVVSPRPFLLQESPCISSAGMCIVTALYSLILLSQWLIGAGGQSTPVGKATGVRRLRTPRPVATSALVHPVRRKTQKQWFSASEADRRAHGKRTARRRKSTMLRLGLKSFLLNSLWINLLIFYNG